MSDTSSITPPSRAAQAWAPLQQRWAALAAPERRALLIGAAVLGAYLLWAIALAPALRTLAKAPAQRQAQELQWQQMQALAREANSLRAVAPVAPDAAQAALKAATDRLGAQAKLNFQGERVLLVLQGVSADQLNAWLAEARAGARARVVEANLAQASPGLYNGSLTLAVGAPR